ncbi:SlyX protein [Geothermobacter hydrogeniphilus]|uniref:SlyX protein n=1 Tax=Geothermobacter hydrogeniphilus TaxID=1969733 RepID=A0A2K2HDS4_9BACT|nr:SlyX family protein [Geothermobacter hydrogeniphilus]PNU21403.1 SlyX protein [Geothermobacter hydrogeniphilus]
MNELEQRLIELEIRSTHQERMIEELNEVVAAEDRRIAELKREVKVLQQALQRLQPELTPSPDE